MVAPLLFEDAELIAVAKPAGVPVIPARGEPPEACLQHQVGAARGERLWVVHRIDRDTSGVVVFARTAEAHRMLNTAFETRQVKKEYLAWAAGALEGVTRIDVALHEARKGKTRPAEPGEPGAKHAVTELAVETRWRKDDAVISRVRCRPITGRHHQLRVHLRWAGAPILHDPLYGKDTLRGPLAAAPCPRLALHAAELTVPGGRHFVAPLPDDLVALERWLDVGEATR
jgi:RluA family pseudouridine synthase